MIKTCKHIYFSIVISWATIDLEPKTAEENLILLPEEKTIVSVCTTNVRLHVACLSPGDICFSNVLFLTFFLE